MSGGQEDDVSEGPVLMLTKSVPRILLLCMFCFSLSSKMDMCLSRDPMYSRERNYQTNSPSGEYIAVTFNLATPYSDAQMVKGFRLATLSKV